MDINQLLRYYDISPLCYWVYHQNYLCVEDLLRRNADPNRTGRYSLNKPSQYPLMIAVKNKNYALIDLLLQFDALPELDALENDTIICPLGLAIQLNDFHMVNLFLDYGASVHKALRIAMLQKNIKMTRYFYARGGNPHFYLQMFGPSVYEVSSPHIKQVITDRNNFILKLRQKTFSIQLRLFLKYSLQKQKIIQELKTLPEKFIFENFIGGEDYREACHRFYSLQKC